MKRILSPSLATAAAIVALALVGAAPVFAACEEEHVSRALGLHPETVSAWLARPRYERRRSPPRGSVLDPFKPRIARLLDAHPYSAQQIFQRLREEGYRGCMTVLRDYVRRIRPPRRPVYLKLHFAPGECAQVDWDPMAPSRWATPAAGCLLRHGAGLQPADVRGVHRLPDHGAFPCLPRTRLRGLRRRSVQNHGRQSQIGGSAAPGRRRAGVQSALSGLRPPPRLLP